MAQNNPVAVDTSASPHCRLAPVPLNAVKLTDEFWQPRREINRTVTLESQYHHLIDTHALRNFERVTGKSAEPFAGMFFADSDVYKWLEAASWASVDAPDPKLDTLMDETIALIASAQSPDGYLNTYFSVEHEKDRWTNLRDMHELYCAGHFIQAAVAHHRATGKDNALDIARKLGNCIAKKFGDGEGQLRKIDGHAEIEMSLVELYRETGERRYLETAQYFIDLRGQRSTCQDAWIGEDYFQDHLPIREMPEIIGHAVRAVYHTCGATDVYSETGDKTLLDALEQLWESMTLRKMYISGGIGSRYHGEAFGEDYELPNSRAYTETCAAIGSVMWAWRMLQISGEPGYADILEQTLYNGVISGLSLSGDEYFYPNPLADMGKSRRQKWFGCACCPPNVARLLASLPGYFYSQSKDDGAIWVHLYASGEASFDVHGTQVTLKVETDYPWDGSVRIAVEVPNPTQFAINLRIPGWVDGAKLSVNGEAADNVEPGRYATLTREWNSGDEITLDLPMPVRLIHSHPNALENRYRFALMRGPLLYCLEAVDNGDLDLRGVSVDPKVQIQSRFAPDLLGGVVKLVTQGSYMPTARDWADALYKTSNPPSEHAQMVTLTAIPYYAWANREPGQMQVWLNDGEAATP